MIYFNDKIFYHNLANFSETDFKNDKFKHNFYELIIFLKGEAELSLNSFSYKLTKQTVALVSPESNRFIKSTSEKPASLIHIYFNPALLPDYFNNINDICDKCYSTKYNSAFDLLVLALQATEKKGYDNEAFLNYLLFAMSSMLFQIELMSDKKQFSSMNRCKENNRLYFPKAPLSKGSCLQSRLRDCLHSFILIMPADSPFQSFSY